MKGIILAGGRGSRLHPLTLGVSKQLLPVYDKPMIYYPLTTLMLAGIRQFLLISTPEDMPNFRRLLGNGSQFGVSIEYKEQADPNGLPEAFILGEDFLDGEPCVLILGDNLLSGAGVGRALSSLFEREGATIFGSWMSDPRAYGVLEFSNDDRLERIVEKPLETSSHWAIPGLYVFDSRVTSFAKDLTPSSRGELEIVDLHRRYLDHGDLHVQRLSRGTTWLDMGTIESLAEAGDFVRSLEGRQGLVLGSPDEVAWRKRWISTDALLGNVEKMGKSTYAQYLGGLPYQNSDFWN